MQLVCSKYAVEEAMKKVGLIPIGLSTQQKVVRITEYSRQRLSNFEEVSMQR